MDSHNASKSLRIVVLEFKDLTFLACTRKFPDLVRQTPYEFWNLFTAS